LDLSNLFAPSCMCPPIISDPESIATTEVKLFFTRRHEGHEEFIVEACVPPVIRPSMPPGITLHFSFSAFLHFIILPVRGGADGRRDARFYYEVHGPD